jgi:hypothetical protein
MNKFNELRNKLIGGSTNILQTPKNTLFQEVEKVAEVRDISQQDIDSFKELPAFCEHLPFEMKKALVSLKILHNTPYEFGVAALLGYANTSCQHLYDVESYKYGVRPISLFIMILLGTGGSKSTIHGELKGPITEYQKRMYEALSNEEMRYITEDKKYKKDIKKWEEDRDSGITSPFPTKPKPVETANYVHEKFTVNGLIDTLERQPHISIVSAEAGKFFSSHAFQNMKQDNNRSTEMTTHLTSLWDGDTISRNIKDDYIRLDNRRGNILFMVQSHVVRDILNNRMFQEQGFTHRILICQVDDFAKPEMSFTEEAIMRENIARQGLQPYLNRLHQLFDKRPILFEDRNFELRPTIMNSDEDSKNYMADFYNNTMNLGKEGNKLDRYEGFANRLHEHCIRIAATIAIFNDHDTITLSDAKCAIDLMNMFIDHRYKLDLGIIDTKPELSQNSVALLSFFLRNKEQMFSKRELRQYGPTSLRNITDEQFVKMLDDLVSKEEITVLETVAGNGRKMQKFGKIATA